MITELWMVAAEDTLDQMCDIPLCIKSATHRVGNAADGDLIIYHLCHPHGLDMVIRAVLTEQSGPNTAEPSAADRG